MVTTSRPSATRQKVECPADRVPDEPERGVRYSAVMTAASLPSRAALDVGPGSPGAARAMEASMESHSIIGGGGIRIHLAETGNPSGRPILFIHGFSQCCLAWRRQMSS